MTKDLNKGISKIEYNCLNLPRLMDIKSPIAEARNEYTYTASGDKLRVSSKWNTYFSTNPLIGSDVNTSLLSKSKTTDYVGNKVYENGVLKRILVDDGYIENGVYHFYLTDHLGNNRAVAKADGSIVQRTQYYPFGTAFADAQGAGVQPYKFGNKEFDADHGLMMYDYSARYYNGISFTSIDPLAEKYYAISPYVYCANNPIKFIDTDGKKIVLPGSAADRQTTLTHLQRITNDKLSMRSDGTVIIVRMGGENAGKYLAFGSELIRDLNKKGDGTKTVTISIGLGGNTENDVNPTNAINGKGSDATVNFSPSSNPLISTKDSKTGNVAGRFRPNEIGLGHELIHADRSMKGRAVDYKKSATHTYKDKNGKTVTQTVPQEELETVGLSGDQRYNENKLRKEQGLDERGAY